MRPNTLAEAFDRIVRGEPDWKALGEFLDAFYADGSKAGRLSRLMQEPARTGDDRLDALAASTAEYLARTYALSAVPAWCGNADRTLKEPWFTTEADSPAMKRYLAWASPAEFRARNIFTEERPLRRKLSHLQPTD